MAPRKCSKSFSELRNMERHLNQDLLTQEAAGSSKARNAPEVCTTKATQLNGV